ERLGFTTDGMLTFQTPLAGERARNASARLNFAREISDRLQNTPGVRAVAATNLLPLTGWSNLPAQRLGHPEHSIGGMEIRFVTPEYFALLGVPVRGGRSFSNTDGETSAPVVMVNETVAHTWWGARSPAGDRVIIGRFQNREFFTDVPREIIGVIADSRTTSPREPPRPTIFIPLAQTGALPVGTLAWVVKTDGNARVPAAIRAAVAGVDPRQRVLQLRTMDSIVAATTAASRFNAELFALFAGCALALAALGVYGLLSFVVTHRRQEIGTRVALGARQAQILGVFLRKGLILAAIGIGLGLAGALVLSRWLATLLYGVQPNDPRHVIAAAVVLFVAALAAAGLPAYRAARIDPLLALRYE
ncbi:MAG TPA: FtsX-like permease family protein, partial [Bryobacteraceae bacterium]|nr:FtsX-like permease family protein [Bryobacteraceae bacterium]